MINLNEKRMNQLEHIIYYEWYLDIRAGGPTGYLANLLDGINRTEDNKNPLILFDTMEKTNNNPEENSKKIYKIIHKIFYSNSLLKKIYINYISRFQKRNHANYINFLKDTSNMICDRDLFNRIDLEETKTIHVHTVGDAVKVRNSLNKARIKDIKLMLTCHTPEAPSDEYYKDYLERGFDKKHAKEVRDGWRKLEKRAFLGADILVFPSREAMEPLEATIEGFSEIAAQKDIRFLASGAKRLKSKLTREEAKKKYGVEGKFVVGYVGRHNEIKGYDLLEKAAESVLNKNDHVCFLIGGKQGDKFKALNHKRWIEAGWVNPADLFMALDVFVLPNRMTYFDLVLLEAMSMGIPVIASNTGGNKSVDSTTGVLKLYDNSIDDLEKAILECSKKSKEEMEQWRKKVEKAYNENYTTSIFAENYIKMIDEIYKDYGMENE